MAFDAMAFDAGDDTPLYTRIKSLIVGRIASGEWPEGTRIPSENELVRDLGVSRMTINRALRELQGEGLLRREQGIGSFVAEQKPQSNLLEIRNIRAEIQERGHSHESRVVTLQAEPADSGTAAALGLAKGATVHHSLLLHLENGKPVQVEERHVNPAFAPDYLKQDFETLTPYEYLTALGPMEAAEHVIEAILPPPALRALLQVGAEEPCLLLTRRTWSEGKVVSRARLTHPGSRYKLAGRQIFDNPLR
ncbi:MAG: histidine utilization repressor [Rhodovibrionaceae bacterium]